MSQTLIEIRNKYYKKYPWARHLGFIRSRCEVRSQPYYKKGIKNFLTLDDIKHLWFRDKAYLMECPSIDRINSKDNYTFNNCRYLERSINVGRPNADKKHCSLGHEYTNENTGIQKRVGRKNARYCKECRKIWNSRSYRKRRSILENRK